MLAPSQAIARVISFGEAWFRSQYPGHPATLAALATTSLAWSTPSRSHTSKACSEQSRNGLHQRLQRQLVSIIVQPPSKCAAEGTDKQLEWATRSQQGFSAGYSMAKANRRKRTDEGVLGMRTMCVRRAVGRTSAAMYTCCQCRLNRRSRCAASSHLRADYVRSRSPARNKESCKERARVRKESSGAALLGCRGDLPRRLLKQLGSPVSTRPSSESGASPPTTVRYTSCKVTYNQLENKRSIQFYRSGGRKFNAYSLMRHRGTKRQSIQILQTELFRRLNFETSSKFHDSCRIYLPRNHLQSPSTIETVQVAQVSALLLAHRVIRISLEWLLPIFRFRSSLLKPVDARFECRSDSLVRGVCLWGPRVESDEWHGACIADPLRRECAV